jgi:hypothetical protein
MITQAIKDMDKRRARADRPNRVREQHISATLWLASVEATVWFDAVGIDQAAALERLDWAGRAQKLLDDPPLSLKPDEHRFLLDGIGVLTRHTRP